MISKLEAICRIVEANQEGADVGIVEPDKTNFVFRLTDMAALVADIRTLQADAKAAHDALGEMEVPSFPVHAPRATPDADGWIEWKGGECPVPNGTHVDIKFRDGFVYAAQFGARYPERLRWSHVDSDWAGSHVDIIAYRIVRAPGVNIDGRDVDGWYPASTKPTEPGLYRTMIYGVGAVGSGFSFWSGQQWGPEYLDSDRARENRDKFHCAVQDKRWKPFESCASA